MWCWDPTVIKFPRDLRGADGSHASRGAPPVHCTAQAHTAAATGPRALVSLWRTFRLYMASNHIVQCAISLLFVTCATSHRLFKPAPWPRTPQLDGGSGRLPGPAALPLEPCPPLAATSLTINCPRFVSTASAVVLPSAGPCGASGFALTFDGAGTDIASTKLPANLFHGASEITISTWIRAFGMNEERRSNPFTLVASTDGQWSSSWFLPMFWSGGGQSFSTWIGDNTWSSSSGDLHAMHLDKFHHWRHMAVVWSSAGGKVKVYVDGELKINATGAKPGFDLGAAQDIYLQLGVGTRSLYEMTPGKYTFRGSLDQLQLWTSALSAQQVQADYETLGSSAILPEAALRYTFDEGAGNIAHNTG
eukprot:2408405-Prymnesium_polylepis.1